MAARSFQLSRNGMSIRPNDKGCPNSSPCVPGRSNSAPLVRSFGVTGLSESARPGQSMTHGSATGHRQAETPQ